MLLYNELVSLLSVDIVTDAQVEELRRLRNATSYGFSTFTGQISYEEQIAWWQQSQGKIKGWLYYEDHSIEMPIYVGFGILRQTDDGRWWNSLGVVPAYQDHGYGSYITHDLIGRHDQSIYSMVVRKNIAAVKMHHTDEWDEITGSDMDNFIYLKSRAR